MDKYSNLYYCNFGAYNLNDKTLKNNITHVNGYEI